MSCPRCGRATQPALSFCTACGAPLALREEPSPRALDAALPLDRRTPRDLAALFLEPEPELAPEPGPGQAPPAARAADRSHWNLGALPSAPEPREAPARAAVLRPGPLDLPEPEVEPLEIHLRRASPGRRALAWAVDVLPLAAAVGALARSLLTDAAALPAPPRGLDGLLDLLAREAGIVVPLAALLVVALFVYTTLAHALAGATLGKWVAGVRLAGPGGLRPTMARSTARSALAVLSAGLLGLGFLVALFTRSGRALHDLGAGTWVVEA